MIVHLTDMRDTIARLLSKLTGQPMTIAVDEELDEPHDSEEAPVVVAPEEDE